MSDKMRLEGLTLTVASVERSIAFYRDQLGLNVAWNAAPAFAMSRHGAGTIGLLALAEASKEGVAAGTAAQNLGIHVEFTTDDLDGLYEELKAKGVVFHAPPHDVPSRRSRLRSNPAVHATAGFESFLPSLHFAGVCLQVRR